MRTLFEIIEGAKDGNKPTHDECYFAMLALSALWHFDIQDLNAVGEKPGNLFRASVAIEESFRRRKTAMATDPQKWLGNQVPGNPEYDRFRKIAFKLLDKIEGKKGGE